MQAQSVKSKPRTAHASVSRALKMKRYFSTEGINPFDGLSWELRDASITGEGGRVVFKQKNVEVPKSWSQLATNVVVSKYFAGAVDSPERETSVRQLISRVVDTIASWAKAGQYFASSEDVAIFRDELSYLLLHQHAAFNSPVWFNVGVEQEPQCSACFINSVDDSMSSVFDLAKTEGLLFKYGSGSGANLSKLRGKNEALKGGGTAGGPLAFMRGLDAFAGAIKSGGKTRRSAKMVMLDVDHPDILEFIDAKVLEEKKAWALIDAGYDGSFEGEAYRSIFFQNANHSVRVSDQFMEAVIEDKDFVTVQRSDGGAGEAHSARATMRKIAEAAHLCGDPGLQFDTTINRWHTCKSSDRIYGSNPCSEYMFLDNTACNLASLNLMKFRDDAGDFEADKFCRAVDIVLTAQEILVDNARYPTETIEENSHRFRPLGLGFANLGALLMARGLPYDSDGGRAYAGVITSMMSGRAYAQSAKIASAKGPFAGYAENSVAMNSVMRQHQKSLDEIEHAFLPDELSEVAQEVWEEAITLGEEYGYRNAQTTVLAPTGTIGFMMDCATTGIEPDISLIKYKKLVGGGMLKMVNPTVPEALERLGYDEGARADILEYLDTNETIEGAPHILDRDLPVFDCAFQAKNGVRTIEAMGHVKMMAAAQPFLSGAISKTVNLPTDVSPDEIMEIYIEAWRLGLKALAVYRDGCKRSQPLNTSLSEEATVAESKPNESVREPARRRLPDERAALTHKFSIAGHEGYVTVGLYEEGMPGEVFITMSKQGSTISGLMDSLATSISLALQYGVPLRVLADKFCHMRFEPSGFTNNRDIPIAKSITDYLFRWLELRFLREPADDFEKSVLPAIPNLLASKVLATQPQSRVSHESFSSQLDAPPCTDCGSIMVRNGACYKCNNCGGSSGCS